jgi:hypothetical protein
MYFVCMYVRMYVCMYVRCMYVFCILTILYFQCIIMYNHVCCCACIIMYQDAGSDEDMDDEVEDVE